MRAVWGGGAHPLTLRRGLCDTRYSAPVGGSLPSQATSPERAAARPPKSSGAEYAARLTGY